MKWCKLNYWIASFFVFFTFFTLTDISVQANGERLIPMGHSIGIQMELDGVYLSSDTMPKKDVWLRMGDKILMVDDQEIKDVEDLEKLLSAKTEQEYTIQIERDHKTSKMQLNIDHLRRMLPLLKNETEGTGTLTYVDPESKTYGALGHQVIDSTFNAPPQFEKGAIFLSTIDQIKKSAPGRPGYKISTIIHNTPPLGSIDKNSLFGIYGDWNSSKMTTNDDPLETLSPSELKIGKGQLLTTINGTKVELFDIEITEINGEQFTFEISDERLLQITGGVFQGMSGSPILQGDKFAGAVTHMFVDEPTEGAALSIVKMKKSQ